MDVPMSSFVTAFTVPAPPPATMILLFSFTARRVSSGISAPLAARRKRAGVPFSTNIWVSFSRSSGPGWQPEVLLRMQVKPEDATWFHCFQIAELYLCTMCLKRWNQHNEEKSTTHVSPIERRCTSLTLALTPDCGQVTGNSEVIPRGKSARLLPACRPIASYECSRSVKGSAAEAFSATA